MNRRYILYFSLVYIAFLQAQIKPEIIWPIDSPRVLTGNYGELRPNHFHAGLDFSTNGKVNLQVYAIEEGYVSRVKVSAVGYGKSVYITHRNGSTSLYAHLNSFSLKIDKLVKEAQYAKQSYEVEFFPKHFSVFVRKNEIIGLSGNSGGSTGPHLHFELRDEKTETPLNPLNYYHVEDAILPVVESVAFYNLADTLHPTWIKHHHIHQHQTQVDTIVLNESILGFAFSGYDQFTLNGNHNNIYSAKLYLDDTLIYSHQFNHIDFIDNRFLNEFSELVGTQKYQRCFLPTLYPPDFCNEGSNKGRIILRDFHSHQLKLLLCDESGNEKKLLLYVKTKLIQKFSQESPRTEGFVTCNYQNQLNLNNLSLNISAGTFYYSTNLETVNQIENKHHLHIQPTQSHLALPVKLGFLIPQDLKAKDSLLVLIGSHGTYTANLNGDSVYFNIKTLGSFQLMADLESPHIKPHFNTKKTRLPSDTRSLSFSIHDRLSGIGAYNLFINDKWVIAEFDAKSDLLNYSFDERTPEGDLKVKLEVKDKVGNSQVFVCTLNR